VFSTDLRTFKLFLRVVCYCLGCDHASKLRVHVCYVICTKKTFNCFNTRIWICEEYEWFR